MLRVCLFVLILQLGSFFQGCAILEYFDSSSKEERKKFKTARYRIPNEMENLKAENLKLQEQIDILNILIKENQRMRDENELLNEQIKNLINENQKLYDT